MLVSALRVAFLKQRNVAIALRDATHHGIPKQRDFYSTGTGIITIITSALGFEMNTSFDQQFCIVCIVSSLVLD